MTLSTKTKSAYKIWEMIMKHLERPHSLSAGVDQIPNGVNSIEGDKHSKMIQQVVLGSALADHKLLSSLSL